ncbi:MAG TPA: SIS domain-containing protein [Acidisoma sp.]|uniref:SIS domain-containing protein n=1 Tax=Acidisoma sp. TaxID=1872115 RepID=UPI002CEAD5EC|nr:SIS domain-containing protein [Acidisoma sp.]HTI02987.1 SIS domain-containing protein [Acidisoma sp.]
MPRPPEAQSRRAGPNIVEVVRLSLDTLRKSERKVAHLVLADPQQVLAATVADVAMLAGVSQPTVIRFCVAVGCTGFHEFRLRLAQSVALGTPATHSAIHADDPTSAVVEKIFDFTLTSLDWARHHLDHAALARTIDILAAARSITFMGFGASGIVALDAEQKFPLFGIPCRAEIDAHQQIMMAAMMAPGDVLVAISNTGLSAGIIKAARIARAAGATTVALTGTRAALSDHCDVTLLAETLDNTNVFTPTTSRVAALVVIDILASAVALRRAPAQLDRMRDMKKTLAGYRQGLDPAVSDPE